MSRYLKSYINDYERYRYMSGIVAGMGVTNLINQNFTGMGFSIIYSLLLLWVSITAKKQSKNAYEFQILNGIYEDVLKEIATSIKKLELGDIEGIFAYINHLYENNYLSYDRHLPVLNKMPIFNEDAILAALSFNNHGVCRNKAPMLVDLYKLFDIEAYGLTGSYFENEHIIVDGEGIISEEEMKTIAENAEKNPEEIAKLLSEVTGRIFNRIEQEREALDASSTGNHAITQANSKDHTYLLDPTLQEFYMDADEDGRFYSNKGNYFKIVSAKKKRHLYKDHLKMEITDKKPMLEPKEMCDILNKKHKIITDNTDIVEEMHKNLEPLLLLADDTYKMILRAK